MLELLNLLCLTDIKMDWSVLEEKSYFKMLGLSFSSKLNWNCYIIYIAKTTFKKFSREVALYLYKSTIDPAWITVVMSELVL